MSSEPVTAESCAGHWVCAFCKASADHRRHGVAGAGLVAICDECVAAGADALGCALVPLNEMPAIEAARRMVVRDIDQLIAIATRTRRELAGA